MKVGVFVPSNNDEHSVMLEAFTKGIRACGYRPIVYDVNDYAPCDVAVVFGIGKKNVPVSFARGHVIAEQHKRKRDVIVIEKGFVKRDEYYMAGWNGLNNRADFCNEAMPSDRWDKLGVMLKPWRRAGENIVVCGQVPSDASVQDIDIIEWSTRAVNYYRSNSCMPIVFRPHPLAHDRSPIIFGAKYSTVPLEQDLDNAWCVVTFNSNAAVEAVIHGVPAVAIDIGSMAWGVTEHELVGGIGPYMPGAMKRQQWANNLAYAQWNKQEFESGEAWLHLTNMALSKTGRLKD